MSNNDLINEDVLKLLKVKYNIDLEDSTPDAYKPVIVLYGPKGAGKTTNALSVPGTVLAFSFDGQTAIIKHLLSEKNNENIDRIKVVNVAGRVAKDDPLEGGSKAVDMTLEILEASHADWILLDGA